MFAPEVCVPALKQIYTQYRANIWTGYGFRDGFNLTTNYWGPDELGIDEGPIVNAIENYRTQRVWKLFMRNPEIQLGLQRAGFVPLAFAPPRLRPGGGQGAMQLDWDGQNGKTYQVEYSPDLDSWFISPTGELMGNGTTVTWTDGGPPASTSLPSDVSQKFYRVVQFGNP